MKINIEISRDEEARLPNSVYVAIAGEVVNRRYVHLINFCGGGQESASNPLLHIHAKRYKSQNEATDSFPSFLIFLIMHGSKLTKDGHPRTDYG